MSKALRTFSEWERKEVASRRIKSETKGLGYWSAVDYRNKKEKETRESK